jgi:gliding motility-associated-like protein
MPDGFGLLGNNTTTQTLIVPKPGNPNIFYIFTASPEGDNDFFGQEKGFRYTVVDISLENGLGNVTVKNTLLTESTTEKMAATRHVNGQDVWVVMHEWRSNAFRSYLITKDGVGDPVISRTGSIHQDISANMTGNAIGQMKLSPSGERLALVLFQEIILEIFDFNPSNGRVRELWSLRDFPLSSRLYGVEFSPDSNVLYITDFGCQIFQFNLSDEDINKGKYVLENEFGFCGWPSQLQLGPDGKIYVANYASDFIGIISSPNEIGDACGFQTIAIKIPADGVHYCMQGLPNFVSSTFYRPDLYPQGAYLEMPNVFTPGNDGYNDVFAPISKYNIKSLSLKLFNRWGQEIFTIEGTDTGWDGSGCAFGSYYWIAEYTGFNSKVYSKKGIVQLLK